MSKALIHEILPVGWLQCNCSVVGDPATREAIVLDPGDDVESILQIVRKHNLKVRTILSTHAHIDHVGGLKKLHDVTGAPVLMHAEDLELYGALEVQASWIGIPVPELASVDGLLRDGDSMRWGNLSASVIHTPGHTPGSICLHMAHGNMESANAQPDRLFSGDTLFAGSIGRTDLWGGSLKKIMHSLETRLLALKDDTLVYPGHGPATTIGQERETNPFLRPGLRGRVSF